jgi:hypothetical protein
MLVQSTLASWNLREHGQNRGASMAAYDWNIDGLNFRTGQLVHELVRLRTGRGQRHCSAALAALCIHDVRTSILHMLVQSNLSSWNLREQRQNRGTSMAAYDWNTDGLNVGTGQLVHELV